MQSKKNDILTVYIDFIDWLLDASVLSHNHYIKDAKNDTMAGHLFAFLKYILSFKCKLMHLVYPQKFWD